MSMVDPNWSKVTKSLLTTPNKQAEEQMTQNGPTCLKKGNFILAFSFAAWHSYIIKGRQNAVLSKPEGTLIMFRIVTRKRVKLHLCRKVWGVELGKQSLKIYLRKHAIYIFRQKGRKRLWSNHGTGNKVAFSR